MVYFFNKDVNIYINYITIKLKLQKNMNQQPQPTVQNQIIPQSKKFHNQKLTKQYKISIQLITETSLDQSITQGLSQQEKIEAVIELRSIHLQWLNIRKIQKLQVFINLNILYLQHNKIAKIQNLECLKNLEYLALNDNLISKIEGLKELKNLTGLNLNNNQIEDIDGKQLPASLQLLSLKENPVCLDTNYRVDLVRALPILQVLDSNNISPEERLKIMGKFPQHLIQYSQKMKQFRNKQRIKKQLQEEQNKKPLYLGGDVNQSDALKEIRETTRKFMHETQQTFKKDLKEQNDNFEQKIKISRKIRNFKQENEVNKEMRMSHITEINQEHDQQH